MGARLGYVARGVVYFSIGAIALLAALRLAPHPHGALEAVRAWSQWPLGNILLWVLGLGLYAFAGWRAMQSILDADNQGRSPKAIGSRIGQAISGLIYGGLAVSVFDIIDTLHDLRHVSEQVRTREAVAAVLEWPAGSTLVILGGVFIMACGIGNAVRAVLDDFGRTLRCDTRTTAWACLMARFGYMARGLAMLPVGFFMTVAGLHARAAEARSVGAALSALHSRPWGGLALAALAIGFMAFAAFAFVESWYRPIRPEGAAEIR